jgi:ribose 5-phosphate isomerase B
MKRILIGNDHGAVQVKERIVAHLTARGFQVENRGVDTEDAVDYPDIAVTVCNELNAAAAAGEPYAFAVLCCGTGIGISISANKIPGIRCAVPQNSYAAQMAREHNDVNVLAFGGRINYPDPLEAMLDAFIDSVPAGGRHARRVSKIMALEQSVPE